MQTKDQTCRFSRSTVMKACNIISQIGHSDVTQFFNELGIDEFDAPHAMGSRHTRLMELAKHAGKNLDQVTAEGEALGNAIVKKAARVDRRYPEGALVDVSNDQRDDFWDNLRDDGYTAENGQLKQLDAQSGTTPIEPPLLAAQAPQPMQAPALTNTTTHARKDNKRVFVVHGRDSGPKSDVARFLERIGLIPVILHEQVNKGRTIIAKFQEEAADVAYAVVLMTPDDHGGLADGSSRPRARQNVIFELGFFIGKLGPANVCALVQGDVETPSDFDAVVYIPYGDATNWKLQLARELEAAGVTFDHRRVIS